MRAWTPSGNRSGDFALPTALVAGVVLLLASGAWGEDEPESAPPPTDAQPPIVWSGEVEVGGRTTGGDDEAGKFREYRDLDSGIVGQYRIGVGDEAGRYYLHLSGENVGYDDQRYSLEAGRYGSYSVDLFYGELPHVFSGSARTLYQRRGGGNVLLLPAGVQANIAGAADPSAQLGLELDAARSIDLDFRQREFGAGVEVQASDAVRLFSRYRLQDRSGTRPLAIQFGSPGGTFDVFASPVDDETHQVEAGLELDAGPLLLGLEYAGSFYENNFRGVDVDNPLVALETPTAAERGRLSLDPDNAAHTISAHATTPLPLPFGARLSANLAYGLRLQDDDFLRHTVNGAIASPGLPARGLKGEVHTLLGNVLATARPLPNLNLRGRYRIQRYDDETDSLRFDLWVRNDDAARSDPVRSVRNDYTRQDLALAASYRLRSNLKATLGYDVESWRRSDDRQVRDLVDQGPSLDLDWRPHPRAGLRTRYAFRDREGDGYDTLAFFRSKLDAADFADLVASGVSELSGLRKFDQADRRLHRVEVTGTLRPGDWTELSLDFRFRNSDYPDSNYGLTGQQSWSVGFDGFQQLHSRIGFGLWYVYEEALYEMASRWRPRSFAPPVVLVDDPRNDWRNDTESRSHTLGSRVTIDAIRERLEIELGYELHLGLERMRDDANPVFVGLGGVNVGTDGGAAFNHPDVEETLHVFTGSFAIRVSDRVKVRALYRYEDFEIDDFRSDDLGPFRGGRDVYLGNSIEDYAAHVGFLSAVFSL